ncbi:hypothetical protein GCM10011354_28760 [Egicoccus halophilus]|uniref:Uncharacterized protein n=1 Tax=Egicoccus halophilus TaxID=1670830 RepID=A0A8J3ACD9_9ACTN|nr:hypothetical protein GCM10011354_28760 [Egicoccus halophilus]
MLLVVGDDDLDLRLLAGLLGRGLVGHVRTSVACGHGGASPEAIGREGVGVEPPRLAASIRPVATKVHP